MVEEGRSARQRFLVLAVPVVAMPVAVVVHVVLGRGLTLVDAALGASMLALVLLRFGSTIWSLDVASKELAERNVRLRESEERFRRLFEDAAVGLATVDAEGRIASVNRALCAIARAPEEDLVGRRFFDFVFPEDVGVLSDDFAAGFAEGRIGPLERRFRAADGTEVWALAGLTVLPEQEVPLVVVNIQDIGDRRQFESELAERNRELEDADRFKNELLSVVSHDLRTPLTSIMGYLELALEDEHAIEGDRRGYLLVAQRNSERLYRLVEDLLFVSRAQAGHAALDLGVVEIGRVVGEVVAAALPVAAAGGVEIVCERDEAGTIVADEHRVAEAVENLVSNAVKFTPPGGRVDVRVEATGDAVAIVVADDGPGIEEDDRRRLFERFFRSVKSEGLPGAGLGLSIVKAIAETHGGSISVESTLGHGATFELRLPRSGPEQGAAGIGVGRCRLVGSRCGCGGIRIANRSERGQTRAVGDGSPSGGGERSGTAGSARSDRAAPARDLLRVRRAAVAHGLGQRPDRDAARRPTGGDAGRGRLARAGGARRPGRRSSTAAGAMRPGEPVTMEYRLRHRDGHDVWVREVGAVEVDEAGVARVQGYVVDLTERRRAEDDLRTVMERLHLVLGQVPALLWTTDAELRIDSASGSGLDAIGVAAADVLGRSVRELTEGHHDLLAGHEQALRGEPREYELLVRTRTLRARVEPLRDRDGRIVGTIGVGFDITEHERATAALRASEELFRAVFDRAGDALLIADDEGRWVDVNPAACELLGRSREELLALRVGEASHHGERVAGGVRARCSSTATRPARTRCCARTERPARSSTWPRANVLPGRHLTLVRDVTERRRLEERAVAHAAARHGRPARRRHRARLQQHAHGDHRPRAAARALARAGDGGAPPCRRDRARDRAGRGAHGAAARVREPPDAPAARGRPQRARLGARADPLGAGREGGARARARGRPGDDRRRPGADRAGGRQPRRQRRGRLRARRPDRRPHPGRNGRGAGRGAGARARLRTPCSRSPTRAPAWRRTCACASSSRSSPRSLSAAAAGSVSRPRSASRVRAGAR